jgi:hypothetical protein
MHHHLIDIHGLPPFAEASVSPEQMLAEHADAHCVAADHMHQASETGS